MAGLESRISAPDGAPVSWADDAMQSDTAAKPEETPAIPQLDGGTQGQGGSGIEEPEFDVEVKLINEDSPLYSLKSFEELGLSVLYEWFSPHR